jgi:hypothetical protein
MSEAYVHGIVDGEAVVRFGGQEMDWIDVVIE